ncbi:hypothetical protein EV356DRAFT_497820 [Viridothelium virens]|uniref:Uncharacterized protein n=1 Tax=Viridothelium virens TaxID=1048519 RepID=A0A6A6HG07_VIRVR|nr:hypothetical protein EV356DRAFT_497820 [Viridothelium virens]
MRPHLLLILPSLFLVLSSALYIPLRPRDYVANPGSINNLNITNIYEEPSVPVRPQNETRRWPYQRTLEGFLKNIDRAAVAAHEAMFPNGTQIPTLSIEEVKWKLYETLNGSAKKGFVDAVREMFLPVDSERDALLAFDRVFGSNEPKMKLGGLPPLPPRSIGSFVRKLFRRADFPPPPENPKYLPISNKTDPSPHTRPYVRSGRDVPPKEEELLEEHEVLPEGQSVPWPQVPDRHRLIDETWKGPHNWDPCWQSKAIKKLCKKWSCQTVFKTFYAPQLHHKDREPP